MKFFQNKIVAIVIAVVVVIASTCISGSVGLSNACDDTEAAFFSVKGGKAPAYYVDQQISAAASLAAIGDHYADLGEVTENLRAARRKLVDAYEDKDIEDIAEACSELREQVDVFAARVQNVLLSENDSRTYADDLATLNGTRNMLLSSSYNKTVDKFMRTVYNRFPATLFAGLFDVDAPAQFAD